jgi:hypothetical protein
MLSDLFKEAIEKFQTIKINAPDVKNNLCGYRDAYIELFNKMFINGLYDSIWSNFTMMRNDCHLFNEQIFTRLNYNIKYTNNPNIKYEPSPEDIKGFLTLNKLNESIQKYIKKLCNIVLDDNYNIQHEEDKNIIIYYRLFHFIPFYFEITTNCNKIYDESQRLNKCSDIKNIFQKITPEYKILKLDKDDDKDDDQENINFMLVYQSMQNIYRDNGLGNGLDNGVGMLDNYRYKTLLSSQSFVEDTFDKVISIFRNNYNNLEMNILMNYIKNKVKEEPKLKEDEIINKVKKEVKEVDKKEDKEEKPKKISKKKEKIPVAVRKIVWNTYIGKDNKSGKCLCCDSEDISNTNFECGHIKSEKNGGEVNIENLRPICGNCNKSIGSNNMDEFMVKYKIKTPKNWNGFVLS